MRVEPNRCIRGETTAIIYVKNIPILVDLEDLECLIQFRWFLTGSGRAVGTKYKNSHISLPSFIFGNYDQMYDHRDRDFRNNRKFNLRPCDYSQNAMNMEKHTRNVSGYKGVSWYEPTRKWQVNMKINKKLTKIGYFRDKREAVEAYNGAVKRHHEEFALIQEWRG